MTPTSSRTGIPQAEPRIGAIVRAHRQAAGLNQAALAGLAGTGIRFISDLERGKPNVALDKLLAVLAVLGLKLQIVAADG
jgi:HTH-type transcriptional regulator/antitoxin HipB